MFGAVCSPSACQWDILQSNVDFRLSLHDNSRLAHDCCKICRVHRSKCDRVSFLVNHRCPVLFTLFSLLICVFSIPVTLPTKYLLLAL
jgi:hypothetical protein